MKVELAPGDTLTISLNDADGEFEVHFDTEAHPKALVIKSDMAGSHLGAAGEIYRDEFPDGHPDIVPGSVPVAKT